MALRREGASTLHRTCADFVASLNSGLADATVELSPPTYAPEMFREPGANLIQISSQGRQMQIAFKAPSQLVSTEKFGTPYLLEGEVRTFNQRMLERFEIRSLLIFFCVENETGSWRFFDGWVTLGGALSTSSHGSGPPMNVSMPCACRWACLGFCRRSRSGWSILST